MSEKIQFKRGPSATIPALADGEPGWCSDTHRLFIGLGGLNFLVGGGGGGGSLALGQPVGASSPNGLLYVDGAGNLAEGSDGVPYAQGVVYEPLTDPSGPALVFTTSGDVIMVPD